MRNFAFPQPKAADSAAKKRMVDESMVCVMDQIKPSLDLFGPAGHLLEHRHESIPHQEKQTRCGDQSCQDKPQRRADLQRTEKQERQSQRHPGGAREGK